MEWIALLGLIFTVAATADTNWAMNNNSKRMAQIAATANSLYKEISQDRDMLNRLYEAYNRRDAALANAIIQSSPFGSRMKKLNEQYQANKNAIDRTLVQINNADQAMNNIRNTEAALKDEYTTSGSMVTDLIGGRAIDPTDINFNSNYQQSNATEEQIKGVKY